MSEKTLHALSVRLGERLQQQEAWVTCAESCTGGLVAKSITDIAGSSAWFDRGFVTYSNTAKHEMLGVAEETLSSYGAVSEAVVREMAFGALKAAGADYAVAISGIAGPGGGSEAKPVGTVWFGLAAEEGQILAFEQHFSGDREAVRMQAAVFALQSLLDEFLEK
ncbi:nicotinamide-nucleotide amidase [Nissabacter sp. SGAir0207]|uniref:nicotinamide-nucleotide amidase n=1 Tax=Nissabacter sp. SGAir0207 TaxID=2126321 RepID=UPI0010CD3796|nr:nicotinamide-nucleotide amidase [Nissabacter sp. SGAir0207]QCR37074.1 nicotinamide-nucleotide amidase [Nissabacter sp. SGAir0207]